MTQAWVHAKGDAPSSVLRRRLQRYVLLMAVEMHSRLVGPTSCSQLSQGCRRRPKVLVPWLFSLVRVPASLPSCRCPVPSSGTSRSPKYYDYSHRRPEARFPPLPSPSVSRFFLLDCNISSSRVVLGSDLAVVAISLFASRFGYY